MCCAPCFKNETPIIPNLPVDVVRLVVGLYFDRDIPDLIPFIMCDIRPRTESGVEYFLRGNRRELTFKFLIALLPFLAKIKNLAGQRCAQTCSGWRILREN